MTGWVNILVEAVWVGWAAFGFGVLFNVPKGYLAAVWVGGAMVGLTKFSILFCNSSFIILATFLAALVLGIYSVILAQIRHEPPMIFAIPSVVPLIPGVFAYRTVYGVIRLGGIAHADFPHLLSETLRNGELTFLVTLAFLAGIFIPYEAREIIFRKANPK